MNYEAEVRCMNAPRRLLGGPVRTLPSADPLPGYLCEQCHDAPAVLMQPAPGGGENGVCIACSAQTMDEGTDGGPAELREGPRLEDTAHEG